MAGALSVIERMRYGMKLTAILLLCCLLFVSAGTSGQAAENPDRTTMVQAFAERIKSLEGFGQPPIIDVEMHFGRKMDLSALTVKMDRNKIALTWLGPNESMGDEFSLQANRQYPAHFVPTTIHGDGPLWHGRNMGLLDKLADDVRTGQYFAMGEFEARHYPSDTNNRDIHQPLTGESFRRVFQISHETGVPFLIHHEAEDKLLAEMETILQQYPQAKVIWCHVGRNRNYSTWSRWQGTKTVRQYLEKYPNLYFDLVQSPPESSPYGYRQCIIYDVNGSKVSLNREWRQLFIDYPDRFVLGSDVNGGRWEQYDTVFTRFRQIVLSDLPQPVAEKLAYKNAWRLMTGQEWK